MYKLKVFLLAYVVSVGISNGALTIQFDFGRAYTANGLSQVADGTVGVLVANTSGNGFSQDDTLIGSVLTTGQLLGENRILGVIQAFDISTGGDFGYGDTINISDFTGITLGSANGSGGTQLAFYWFPGITTMGSTITDGQSYGFFRSDLIDDDGGSDISFNMPADGGFYSLIAYETDLGGIFSAESFQANFIAGAIPEPSRVTLLGLAGTLALFRRRRVI